LSISDQQQSFERRDSHSRDTGFDKQVTFDAGARKLHIRKPVGGPE
jgi:hypothetical protein